MEYLKNKYSEVELIKKDNWADIYVAINNETQEKVQLKLLKSQSDNKKYISSITYAIDQLQNLKHKNLIGINGIYNFIENNIIYYYIETEYFKSKTLSEKMILTGHTCKESLEIIKQVAEGLNEFHYRGLNYETLSVENIFINPQGVAKIDVLSYIQQKYDEDEEYDTYDEFDEGIDKDIYAVGVILYQLITRDQDFKLRKLKKNIEDEEVYSMLYSLTSKNVKYRYQDLKEFLSDVDEHLAYLSSDTNEDVQYINENKREIKDDFEDDFEEYEYESSKFVLIKRLCACAILLLVVGFGGMKVMALLDKDDKEANAPMEMVADEDSKDEEDLEENSEEETVDEVQVNSNDTDINTNSNSTINDAIISNSNSNTNTNTNTNTDTENTTGSNNNNSTITNRPSSGTTTNKPSSGTTTNKPSGGTTTNKPSGGTTTNKPSGGTTTKPDDEDTTTDSGDSNNGSNDTGVDTGTSNGGDTDVDSGSDGEITEVE